MTSLPEYVAGVVPPSAAWMGMELLHYSPDERSSRVSFKPRSEMCNFGGVMQGGFLAAMMDDAMGALAFHVVGGRFAPATIDLGTHFFLAVPLERIEVAAHVIRAGKAVAFAEARLYRSDGELAAQATASMKMRPFQGLQFPADEATDAAAARAQASLAARDAAVRDA